MYTIDKKAFGAFVAALRREKGYTQKEMAEKLFVSDKAVSKWETGASIPDTALLIPLAELLDVTVTELLLCERREEERTMDTGEVESVVKTAIAYSGERPPRAFREKGRWPAVWLLCAAICGVGMLLNRRLGTVTDTLTTSVVLTLLFGTYFCILAKTELPRYYDENRCGLYVDGPFRMNVPGVSFNNRNWPRILRAVRLWGCASAVLLPLLNLGMFHLMGEGWLRVERYVLLAILLGGLFGPIYAAGRQSREK